jgi:hypothetical protein
MTNDKAIDLKTEGQTGNVDELGRTRGQMGSSRHFRHAVEPSDLKPTKTIVTRILASIPAARETPDRARGATGSTALCQSADAGSNPAGSVLPSVEKIYTGERTQR